MPINNSQPSPGVVMNTSMTSRFVGESGGTGVGRIIAAIDSPGGGVIPYPSTLPRFTFAR